MKRKNCTLHVVKRPHQPANRWVLRRRKGLNETACRLSSRTVAAFYKWTTHAVRIWSKSKESHHSLSHSIGPFMSVSWTQLSMFMQKWRIDFACLPLSQCDGQYIPLPSLQGIAVLNIPSYAGGTNFWGGTKEDDVSTFTACLPEDVSLLPLGSKFLQYVATNLHKKDGKCNRWRTFSLRSTAADGYFCCCFCSNKWSALIEHFSTPSWFSIALNHTSFSPTHAHTDVWLLPWTNYIIKKKKTLTARKKTRQKTLHFNFALPLSKRKM